MLQVTSDFPELPKLLIDRHAVDPPGFSVSLVIEHGMAVSTKWD